MQDKGHAKKFNANRKGLTVNLVDKSGKFTVAGVNVEGNSVTNFKQLFIFSTKLTKRLVGVVRLVD